MEYIEKNREKIIRDLLDCVSFPSVPDNREATLTALVHVLKIASDMGMRTYLTKDKRVGTIEIGQGEETLGILVHIDVVDGGNRALWICDPFKGEIINDKIYGRGTLDDKGPLIASLHAMKAAMEDDKPFTKKVRMIIGTQEETEWSDMENYVKSHPLPDYGFTPDGEFPICNIEKGCVDVVISFPLKREEHGKYHDANGCNGECRDGLFIEKIEGGTAPNIVPGRCKVWFSDGREIETIGKAVHSSRPEKGENAIMKMAEKVACINGLEAYNPIAEKLEVIKKRLSDIYGSGMGIFSKSEYYNGEFIHRNVISPTLITIKDGNLELTLNIRFSCESTEEEVIAAVEKFCREEGGQIKRCSSLPAVYVDRKEPFLVKLAEAYESVTGVKNDFALAYGGSYAKAMKRMVSWGPILPGMEDGCHEENEYITIDDLLTNLKIYYEAIIRIAKDDRSFI